EELTKQLSKLPQQLKERLKGLKGVIEEWSRLTYGVAEEKKKRLIHDIMVLDIKSEALGLVDGEVDERKKLFEELWMTLKSIDMVLNFQRSRSKWLKEGDTNSKYFHNCVKASSRRNKMVALRTANGWVEGPIHVREEVVMYFRNHFANEDWHRPTLDNIEFSCLPPEGVDVLTAIFTLEEITRVVKDSDGSKSLGPDGFNFAFIKEFWDLLKFDIRIMFDQFHGNATLPKGILSYFITLIPKVYSPQSLGDFRPISLLGCLYKLIAKVLASRLAKVVGDLIPKTQSAFLKGRQLVDGVVVVNEVIDFAKRARKECLILKVDFEKAYDSVD
ncbi:LINE-1 reverse transcriptase like, partial [Trifolium medium]|nr:LINE-1 reverse transcriptase like [Trifolium medium]